MVQASVLLAELDLKAQSAGLVTPLGTAADTGIAGLTLGGGQGRLMRALGLSCDNVRAFELVTASGQTLEVDEHQNPGLYWGLRGGGGNFGVVTRFDYRLHPLGHPVLAGGKVYPFSQARSVLAAVADLAHSAPNELYLSAGINNVAPGGSLPAGRYVAIEVLYAGKPGDGAALLAPLAKLGKPILDTVVPKAYVAAQNGATEASPPALPPGLGVYLKSGFIDKVSDAVIGEMIHAFDQGPERLDGIGLGTLGGAITNVKPSATAYWNRDASWELILDGAWSDHSKDQNNAAALRDLWKAFEPLTKGYYVNTEPSADERRLRATYGDNYARLVQLKDRYDPDNFFRLNANIKPTIRT